MASKRILVEWKARDLKRKHAWIVDRKDRKECKICDPNDVSIYIDPKRVGYRSLINGKDCPRCVALWPGIMEQFAGKLDVIRMEGKELNFEQINRKR